MICPFLALLTRRSPCEANPQAGQRAEAFGNPPPTGCEPAIGRNVCQPVRLFCKLVILRVVHDP